MAGCDVDPEGSPPEVPSVVDVGRPFNAGPPRPFGDPV